MIAGGEILLNLYVEIIIKWKALRNLWNNLPFTTIPQKFFSLQYDFGGGGGRAPLLVVKFFFCFFSSDVVIACAFF